jgi:hypothetical protein
MQELLDTVRQERVCTNTSEGRARACETAMCRDRCALSVEQERTQRSQHAVEREATTSEVGRATAGTVSHVWCVRGEQEGRQAREG